MNNTKTIVYQLLPTNPFPILRNCPGCVGTSRYESTGRLRVNANGKRLDVWLIYQCSHCKHTYNLSIYERKRPDQIPAHLQDATQEEANFFAFSFGTSTSLFRQNKVKIDWKSLSYKVEYLEPVPVSKKIQPKGGDCITIKNPYHLKLRLEQVLAEILSLSRTRCKRLLDDGSLLVTKDSTSDSLTIAVLRNPYTDIKSELLSEPLLDVS